MPSAVVPLLGGLAGANAMAREIAAALEVRAAITTSGEFCFGTCVLNPPGAYALADLAQGERLVSDLLACRLRHAAEADLVMAFYNPVSRTRPWQLDHALAIVREFRAANTASCWAAISADPARN